ncbi:MAG: hypothetical protein H2058_11915 [Muricauda sp.]|nr:hypothetical protein [Allomuricauda sp.]MBA4745952.1 hypothetical protein [Allomuricauda sp.]
MSQLFKCIAEQYANKQLDETLKVSDVRECLGKSKPFLAKHSLDPNKKRKKFMGNHIS